MDAYAQHQMRYGLDTRSTKFANAHLVFMLMPIGISFLCLLFTGCKTPELTGSRGITKMIWLILRLLCIDFVFIYLMTALRGTTTFYWEGRLNSDIGGRKLEIYFHAIPNALITIAFIFYVGNFVQHPVNEHILIAWILLSLNAILALAYHSKSIFDINNRSFGDWLRYNFLTTVFFSLVGEIFGRLLFIASLVMYGIDDSDFHDQDQGGQNLLPEFLIWDALAATFVVFFILMPIYFLKNRNFRLSVMHASQMWTGYIICRHSVDNDSYHQLEQMGHMQAIIHHDYNFQRHLFLFPILWRLGEYIAITVLIVDGLYLHADGLFRMYQILLFSAIVNVGYAFLLVCLLLRGLFDNRLFGIKT